MKNPIIDKRKRWMTTRRFYRGGSYHTGHFGSTAERKERMKIQIRPKYLYPNDLDIGFRIVRTKKNEKSRK